MKCVRCGQEFDMPNTNICGTCADDLRADEESEIMIAQASDDELTRQEYEDAERKAYEVEEAHKF